eukprot:CAMPEP_0174368006 /NCGR_PEP_ID=MMETSP0811_2-20130205/87452_1 /TAXON_ID=73025 ORGANISM="Eutreptiella gymnastica-like, Strain CCMP1594" /NCGR_SAMPLE_ID=MMETSP0811_2 /ASSEMBLY_ACC=CAM_ASM_000667 /LENGTH=54 /DNA_ID=CAMNT_0015511121 /DNA_START=56 /DNA_END=217 /DNA_ORIENTATION=+
MPRGVPRHGPETEDTCRDRTAREQTETSTESRTRWGRRALAEGSPAALLPNCGG